MKESPMKNMAYWKAKNATPVKMAGQVLMSGMAPSASEVITKTNPNATVEDKVNATVEKKVDEVVNKKSTDGLV